MFVIACKYNPKFSFVIDLIESIRKFHPTEKIVVVDSDSDDKSYFSKIEKYNVIIEDVANKNWMVGAYWHTYKKYPDEEFYFFLQDSMIIKDNLDYLKEKDLTIWMHFDRSIGNFNSWGNYITENSKYEYVFSGRGCSGIIFFCKNKVMKRMLEMGADKFLPSNKTETGHCEGSWGFFFEEQGYDLRECSLYGDILNDGWFRDDDLDYSKVRSPYSYKTSWQFPIEKFCASCIDTNRGWSKEYLISLHGGYKCSICDISEWNGIPINLEIYHKDGNPHISNYPENLYFICPNCHSQIK